MTLPPRSVPAGQMREQAACFACTFPHPAVPGHLLPVAEGKSCLLAAGARCQRGRIRLADRSNGPHACKSIRVILVNAKSIGIVLCLVAVWIVPARAEEPASWPRSSIAAIDSGSRTIQLSQQEP